jgi:hypothetical protein
MSVVPVLTTAVPLSLIQLVVLDSGSIGVLVHYHTTTLPTLLSAAPHSLRVLVDAVSCIYVQRSWHPSCMWRAS